MKKRILSMLLVLVMLLTILPVSALADEGAEAQSSSVSTASTSPVQIKKTVTEDDDGTYRLTMEAYVTGVVNVQAEPADIVLLLDVSGSMTMPVKTQALNNDYSYKSYSELGKTLYYLAGDGNYYRVYSYAETVGEGRFQEQYYFLYYVDNHDDIQYFSQRRGQNQISTELPVVNRDNTVLYSGVLYEATETRMDALQQAANAFVESTAAQNANRASQEQHQISIVKFANDVKTTVGNDFDFDQDNANYTQTVVSMQAVTNENLNTFTGAINSLVPAGATAADYGLHLALENLDDTDTGRSKVIVLFTDGEPNHNAGFDYQVAAEAVNQAKTAKENGTTIYTVGLGVNAGSGTDMGTYMSAVSSNYPAASASATDTNWTVTLGVPDQKGGYFQTASDANSLEAVFKNIEQSIVSSNSETDETSVLSDTLSDYFALPEEAAESDVEVYTATYQGNGQWGQNVQDSSITAAISDKTITVQGFDYAENCVIEQPVSGKKLVISFPIVPDKTCTQWENGTNSYATNASAALMDSDGQSLCELDESPNAPVTAYAVTYNWGENAPEDRTLPVAGGYYIEGQSYLVDTTYSSRTTVDCYDEDNKLTGTWTFSGWDQSASIEIEKNDVVITGSWSFESSQQTAAYKVEHYKEVTTGGAYELAETDELSGMIGEMVTATAKTYGGYVLNLQETGTVASGEVTEPVTDENGNEQVLTLKLYYSKDVVGGTDPDTGDDIGDNIPDKYQAKVTFKVVNGAWNDKTTAEIVKYVTLLDADGNYAVKFKGSYTLTAADVPTAGGEPNEDFAPTGWWKKDQYGELDPVGAKISNDATFIFYYLPPITLTITVEDKTVAYTGEEQYGYDGDVTVTIRAAGLKTEYEADHVTVSPWNTTSGSASRYHNDGDQVILDYTPASGTEIDTYDNATYTIRVLREGQDVSDIYEVTVEGGKLNIGLEQTPVEKYAVYQIEHYVENDEGGYDLKETTFPAGNGKIGDTVSVKASDYKAYEGYALDLQAEGTVTSAQVIEPEVENGEITKITTLKLYYSKDVVGDTDPETGDDIGDNIPDKYQAKVTFKVVNGAWNDKTTAEIVKYVTLRDADGNYAVKFKGSYTLTEADVPTAGDEPNEDFAPTGWWKKDQYGELDPVEAKISNDATFIFYYLPPITLTITVEDKTVAYTGEEQYGYDGDVTVTIRATGLKTEYEAEHVTVSRWNTNSGSASRYHNDGDQVILDYTPASGTEIDTYDNATYTIQVLRRGQDVSDIYKVTVEGGKLNIVPEQTPVEKYAVYQIEHYVENDEGGYDLKETTLPAGNGKIGDTVSAKASDYKTYEGYALDLQAEGTVTSAQVIEPEVENGEITKITTLKLYYSKDVIGDTDPENGGDIGDNIPDKYQVIIVYVSANTKYGTVTGITREVKTIYASDGSYATSGTVTASGSAARAKSGYTFRKWTNDAGVPVVTTAVLGEQTIETAQGGATYTFTANFAKAGTSAAADTKPALNTEDHVAYIIGYTDGTVKPTGTITRAEVATIFFRLLTDESRAYYWSQTNPFSDVKETDWYNNAISTLYEAGIIVDSKDTFRPNEPITRAELAVMAAQFTGLTTNKYSSFTDVAKTHWAAHEIAIVEEQGWIEGYTDGTFHPDATITRAETMTIVNRMLERAVEKDHMVSNMVKWVDNPTTAWYYEAVQEATNSHEYVRLNEKVPGESYCWEDWQNILKNPDWAALEKSWSHANSK